MELNENEGTIYGPKRVLLILGNWPEFGLCTLDCPLDGKWRKKCFNWIDKK